MITGRNGAGKTSVLEAVGLPRRPCGRSGAPRGRRWCAPGPSGAILRAETRAAAGQPDLVEAEIVAAGRSRTQVNRQAVRRPEGPGRGAAGARSSPPRTSAWSAAGRPSRREFLDDALAVVDAEGGPCRPRRSTGSCASGPPCCARPAGGSAGGRGRHPRRLGRPAGTTPGTVLVEARERLVERAGAAGRPGLRPTGRRRTDVRPVQLYVPRAGTATSLDALAAHRDRRPAAGCHHGRAPPRRPRADPRRACRPDPRLPGRAALPGPGPAAGRPPARATERLGTAPVLLLDDVFSELDPARCRALLGGAARRADRSSPRPARCPPGVDGGARSSTSAARRPRRRATGDRRRRARSRRTRRRLRAPAARRVASRPRPSPGPMERRVGRLFAGGPRSSGRPWPSHVRPVRARRDGPWWWRGPPGLGHPGPARSATTLLDRAARSRRRQRPARLEVGVQRV